MDDNTMTLHMKLLVFVGSIFAGITSLVFPEETESSSIRSYQIESSFQRRCTTVRILLPDKFDAEKPYRVLYILPVVANDARKYGDGLLEVMKYNYHNVHQLICVAPEFTSKPWYADHSTDMGRQDESHLLKRILPFVDNKYPTLKTKEGRLLLGFSKSGWGAFTLLLRNPSVFYKAAGWDTGIRVDTGPLDEEDRMRRIQEFFGSRSNFEKHRISNLLKKKGKLLENQERLFYYNTEGSRARGGAEIHRQMVQLEFPHRYLFEPKRKHRWDSGWIPLAVEFLVED
ncbi:MAG TPA: hypothetical protein EYQ50_10100 [Verrucomicrobiales bacterium]|nr:hypothetical protein [Verrucomicrobiales bacterium]HIL71997.1 hypothetical protein [Verrucomicrobiota bacterium]